MSTPASGLRYSIRVMEGGLTLGFTATAIPEDVSPEALVEVLMLELQKRGITYGLDREVLLHVFTDNVLNEELDIAHGTPPRPGKDGDVELLMVPPSFTATEGEGGRVDYRNVENVSPVKAGDVISRKTAADPGEPGVNVFGKPVRPPLVKDARHPAGRNTALSDDGLEMRAAVDGFLRWNGQKIDVLELYGVKGDVDLRTGNVRYDKDVEVLGSVQPGFQVIAGGDVHIYGSVESGTVTAGGSIIINGGVMGSDGNPAVVTAEGDIQIGRGRFARIESKTGRVIANFAVEHSEIRAAGDLILRAGPAMSCVVEVGGNIDVTNVSTRTALGQAPARTAPATQSSSSNRRQHLRVRVDPLPTVQVHGDMPSDVRPGVILDLSAGGLRVRLPEHRLKEGDRHRVQFNLDGVSGTMWGEAEVIRECEPPSSPHGRSYGLKFVQMEPAVREAITRFCLAEDLRQHRAAKESSQ